MPPDQVKSLAFALGCLSKEVDVADLPEDFKRLSCDGKIYLTRTRESEYVLWRTDLGKSGHFHGVVFWQGLRPNPDDLELNAPSARGVRKWEIAAWKDASVRNWAYVATDFME